MKDKQLESELDGIERKFTKPSDHFTIKVPPTIASVLELEGEAEFEMNGKFFKIIEENKYRQEIKKMLEGLSQIKVIEPPEEVEKLSYKRQAFMAGQMNVIYRLIEKINSLLGEKDEPKI